MNIVRILEHMGYVNGTDFTVKDDLDGNGPYIATWSHVDTQPTPATLTTNEAAAELAFAKTQAKRQVDTHAGVVRLKFVTDADLQETVYQDKSDEATDYVAAGYPVDLSSYPFIQAEVNATGKTSTQAADDILAAKSNWITRSSQIEEQRLTGKGNIDSAVDLAGVTSAKDAAITALDAI